MSKVIGHALMLIGSFFALWYGLAQVDWISLLRVQRAADATEQQIGKAVWDVVSRDADLDRNPQLTGPVDTLLRRLCDAAGNSECPVRAYVVRDNEVNAFALPDGRMIITTGLLRDVQNEAELAGVIGHEYAHIEGRHVMNKLAKEIGLAVLISTNTGGADVVQQVLQSLSSTAYDRRLESEADRRSVELMIEARMDPKPLGDLTYRLGQNGRGDQASYLRWLSTHPEPEERSLAILEQAREASVKAEPVLTSAAWAAMKKALSPDPT